MIETVHAVDRDYERGLLCRKQKIYRILGQKAKKGLNSKSDALYLVRDRIV